MQFDMIQWGIEDLFEIEVLFFLLPYYGASLEL